MSKIIKRYRPASHMRGMWPDLEGDYVLFNEFDAERLRAGTAVAEVAALREELATAKRVGPPHFCGLPMSRNPHPEAGVPGRFLEVGTVSECIPCLVSSRHGWAKTAGELQQRLADAEQRNSELIGVLEMFADNSDDGDVVEISRHHIALSKPTESGASE